MADDKLPPPGNGVSTSVEPTRDPTNPVAPASPPPADAPPAAPSGRVVTAPETASPDDDGVGSGSTFQDIKMAFKHNTGWLGAVGEFVQGLFHYFFIGCTSLLGLLLILLVPLTAAAAVGLLLGLPGYFVYHWFNEPGHYISTATVLVTIFWSGYFVTHGWPHLSDALSGVFGWVKPGLVWMGRVLENITEDDEDEPPVA